MQKIHFDYYRGMEAEQYTFYRIPKILFTAECFRSLSCEAKVLYGLLLDRMSLSIKNRWFDEEDRVYIIFRVEEIAEFINCGTQKAVKLLKELDADQGIGLIEKKRLGLGKPNVIYVKNFVICQTEEREKQAEMPENAQNGENHNLGMSRITIQEYPEPQFQNGENHNSGMMKDTIPEYPGSQFQNDENHNSRIVKTTIQECPKSQSNNTNINNTEYSETEYSNTELSETEVGVSNPIHPNLIPSIPSIPTIPHVPDTVPDVMKEVETIRDMVRGQISYGDFLARHYCRMKDVDELVELVLDVLLLPDEGTLRIAGVEKPVVVVKDRFRKLDHTHIEYILSCLSGNTTKVGNIRAYLLTTLYNAPATISHYYMAEVNHDLYGNES